MKYRLKWDRESKQWFTTYRYSGFIIGSHEAIVSFFSLPEAFSHLHWVLKNNETIERQHMEMWIK